MRLAPPVMRIAFAAPLVAALGCTSIPEKPPIQTAPVSVTGEDWRVTDNVIVITDASGTMWAKQTFPEAKSLTRSFVAALPSADARAAQPGNYNTGLIGFGGDDRKSTPLASFDRGRLASTASELQVMGDISGMGGTTPYAAVLTEAQQELQGKRGRAALVIFSDGMPDSEEAAMYAAQRLVTSYPDELCIHAVHTGEDPEGYAFLQRLTQLTSCGSIRAANSVGSGPEVQRFASTVMLAPGLPAVAAGPGPCAGVIRLRGIEFAFDSDAIRDDSKPVLDVAVEQLNRCPDINITITGHTDSIGTEQYNMGLSDRRAQAARRYFIQSGVAASRLDAEGMGESDPIAPNDSAAGRAQNRRVELAPSR
jgi:OOP family OmpA-OmpF porin